MFEIQGINKVTKRADRYQLQILNRDAHHCVEQNIQMLIILLNKICTKWVIENCVQMHFEHEDSSVCE